MRQERVYSVFLSRNMCAANLNMCSGWRCHHNGPYNIVRTDCFLRKQIYIFIVDTGPCNGIILPPCHFLAKWFTDLRYIYKAITLLYNNVYCTCILLHNILKKKKKNSIDAKENILSFFITCCMVNPTDLYWNKTQRIKNCMVKIICLEYSTAGVQVNALSNRKRDTGDSKK